MCCWNFNDPQGFSYYYPPFLLQMLLFKENNAIQPQLDSVRKSSNNFVLFYHKTYAFMYLEIQFTYITSNGCICGSIYIQTPIASISNRFIIMEKKYPNKCIMRKITIIYNFRITRIEIHIRVYRHSKNTSIIS